SCWRFSITVPAPTEIHPLSLHDALPILDPVGQPGLHQLLFDRPRLRVGAVEHGVVAGIGALGDGLADAFDDEAGLVHLVVGGVEDRKSTRLNSSHVKISYAVFCLKKKNT